MSDAEARFKLTIIRSEQLKNFHAGCRNQGFDALEACELTHEHAKYLDATYERDLEVLRVTMEQT